MVEKDRCYMCDLDATSREHVPPICLFPESKDVKGLNFRKNLITVPSCEKHNSKKSHDDEFLMVAIAGVVGNNELGYMQTISKVNRALRRKSSDFLSKAVMRNLRVTTVKSIDGYEFPVLFGNPNHSRLVGCFEQIIRGLYYHENNKKFFGKVSILLGFIHDTKKDNQTFLEFIRKRFELEDLRLEAKGNNPEVFTYQFCAADDNGVIEFKLIFYGGTEVFGAMIPEGTQTPYDLVHQLMTSGMPVTYTLGEEEFHFNRNQNPVDNFSHQENQINKTI